MRKTIVAVCLGVALAGGYRIRQDVILNNPDMCQQEDVCNSWFWRIWYGCTDCSDAGGGGESGARE